MSPYLTALALIASSLVEAYHSLPATRPAMVQDRSRRDSHRKIFFLFMANDRVPHADIWERFFSKARKGEQYEVLLHCQDEVTCRKMSGVWGPHFSPEVIPAVPSKYCDNLIDPMLALLRHALEKEPSKASPNLDQFVFVSDTTVPIKPFFNVSSLLRGQSYEATTRMCVEPWNVGKHAHNGSAILVKHSQWITLGRKDSKRLLSKEFMYQKVINVNQIGGEGCSDEYWFFAVLYGLLKPRYGETFEHAISRVQHFNEKCDTFVDWDHQFIDASMPVPSKILYGPPTGRIAAELFTNPAGEKTAVMTQTRRGLFGPAEVREFSPETLKQWRASSWSFMRKVSPQVIIKDNTEDLSKADAFSKYVLHDGL